MRNILVLNNEALLGAAISSLLQAEEDLELFGFTPSSPADLIDTLRESCYLNCGCNENRSFATKKLDTENSGFHSEQGIDVLILDNTLLATSDVRRFLSQLNAQLGTCVIVIDTVNNLVTVNNVYNILIHQPEDLIEIVRHDQPRFSTQLRDEPIQETKPAKHADTLRNTDNKKSKQPKHRRPFNPTRCCTHSKPNLT